MLSASGSGALRLAAAPVTGGPPIASTLSPRTDGEALRARAEAILREGGYQAALPQDPGTLDLSLGPAALLLRILLWGALAVLAWLALSWLVRRFARAPRDAAPEEPSPAPPAGAVAERADVLAAEGRFAEAIHALLLDALAALAGAARLAPSLTSREIVRDAPLSGPARDALDGLVAAVERSRFGGAAAGAEDYRACLGRFRTFLDGLRGTP